MLTVEQAEARAAALVEAARKAGADAADAVYSGEASTGIQVRLGELEDVSRSEGEEIGLRFFAGTRSASVSSSDLSDEAMRALVERASALAPAAPADHYARPPRGRPRGEGLLVGRCGRGEAGAGRARVGDGPRGAGGPLCRPRAGGEAAARA